ncbi:MAG TPA: EF-P lysine aminoacylase EpmA [Gammaproteobacteria bacterium]
MAEIDWRPAATRDTLELRAGLLREIREFFAVRDVLEVETPALSGESIPDPALDSIAVSAASLPGGQGYLRTSPEFEMKRLVAAGVGDIFQVCRVFRDNESGRWHEPEFTLIEWYRLGWDDQRLMDEVDELLTQLLTPHRAPAGALRLRYREVIEAVLGVAADAGDDAVRNAILNAGVDVPADTTGDALLDLALSEVVSPGFDPQAFTFVCDYPETQAALARIKPGEPPVAARFELFFGGIELANGFAELTDAAEQRARFESELERRREAGRHAPALDERFLGALAAGLPDCAGVAIGFDRVVALAAGLDNIAEAIAFPHR